MLSLSLLSACSSFHVGALPGEPPDATFARVAGTRVRYVDEGRAVEGRDPVVLVHGFASSLETWAPLRNLLQLHKRVLALDLKGFGWTDRPPGDYSPEAQAELVLALMDARGIGRASFVGHSYGASVVLALALRAPERVARIVLYDAWVYAAQLPTFFHLARVGGVGEVMFAAWYQERAEERLAIAFHDPSYVTPERVDHVLGMLSRPGTTAAALAAVRGMTYERTEARYREIAHPALVLWGREDRITPVAIGERLVRDLPGARLVVYPRCGHFPMYEAAAESSAEVLRFLEAR